jgi:hypothetical protein
MNPLHWMIQFAFGCNYRHLSRVFTIKMPTYKVCLDCGHEFDLPLPYAARSNVSEIAAPRSPKMGRAHVATI